MISLGVGRHPTYYNCERLSMDYCDEIFDKLLKIHDPECLRLVREAATVKTFKKKEVMLRAGEVQAEIPFIISGSFWGYYVDSDGKIRTDCITDFFGCPVTASADIQGFLRPSDVCFEALEDSEAYCVPTSVVIHIIQTYPEVVAAMGKIIHLAFTYHRRLQYINTLPLQQRYEEFCGLFPAVTSRLSRTQLAAILNVSLPALSRALGEKQ